ncbi:unnamed protein product [Caenorhabditis auriculariae]|uniref:TOG domain-containing protein n=1 Tax=Caenorhabditis auriculariae TaxID=2777116 RepID=A0A8S1GTG8_9PELO|nr:unnamed protein product [Caenorhabditis auriculariae]
MSSWDYIDEVDILPKLPPNFEELRESKKWQERKESLDALLKVLMDAERLSTKISYAELVGNLQTMIAKDANINIQALAAKCLTRFATGLRTKFAPFAQTLLPILFEKLKEKKPLLKEPLIECSDAVASTMPTLETSQDDIILALGKPNPQIKQQCALFLGRQFDLLSADKQPKKLIKAVVPVLGKLLGDADADVREAATTSLGAIQRLIGEKNVKSILGDVASDEAKMKKVAEAAENSAQNFAEISSKQQASGPAEAPSKEGSSSAPTSSKPNGAVNFSAPAKEVDEWDFADPFHLLGKMPADFETNIESKKWTERRDALQALHDLLKANVKLDAKGNYGELVGVLRKVLEKDANINVAALAANCLKGIADGLRLKFQPHAAAVIPVIFDKFKEKKPLLRDPLIACIDAMAATTNLEAMGEDILAALAKPNPNIKIQADLFLYRAFKLLNSQTMPKKTLKSIVPLLIKHSGDSDPEVRDASYAAMGSMMRTIGEKPSLQLLADIVPDKLKMDKIRDFHQKALEEAGADVVSQMVQSVHKADAPAAAAKTPLAAKPATVKEDAEETEEALKQSGGGAAGAKKKEAPEKKKAPPPKEEEDEPPVVEKAEVMLAPNTGKAQRLKDEKNLKILKWNFTTPTDEHIEQLQNMLGAYAKVSLMSQLFHKDFKMHLKALDLLINLASSDETALTSNSDLLLKWCTLRFFETNPAALVKVLELCRIVTTLIRDTSTPMTTEEMTAFVPYLLLKTGDPKENIRNSVREIVDILSDINSPAKMAPLLLDGLKSKNARQRAECLLVVENYVTVVGITTLKAANIEKTVAPHVGDKDVGVRNAAINVLVACYRFEGDQMWRAAGKMPDKDRSLVEERIKRSGVAPGSGVPQGGGARVVVPQQSAATAVRRSASRTREPDSENIPSESAAPDSTFALNTPRRPIGEVQQKSSRYALRDDYISSLAGLADGTIGGLEAPHKGANQGFWPSTPLKRTGSSSSISSVDTSDQLERAIQNISSGLPDVARDAMFQVTYMLDTREQRQMIERRMDLLFRMATVQVQFLTRVLEENKNQFKEMADALSQLLFRAVGGIDEPNAEVTIFDITKDTIADLFTELLKIISVLGRSEDVMMARSFNRLTMRIVYRIELTSLLCGLVTGITNRLKASDETIAALFAKLLTKWKEELDKRTRQMRVSDIVACCDTFFHLTLGELKWDLTHPLVTSVDNAIECVVLLQGEAVLDAVRRLLKPHMHLTSIVNKMLQVMKEQGKTPALPGTLEDLPAEEETIISRPILQVHIDNIIRDPSKASDHVERLKSLLSDDLEARSDFLRKTSSMPLGKFVQEITESKRPVVGASMPISATILLELSQLLHELDMTTTPSPDATPSSQETAPADLTRTLTKPKREPVDAQLKKRRTMSRAAISEMRARFDEALGNK